MAFIQRFSKNTGLYIEGPEHIVSSYPGPCKMIILMDHSDQSREWHSDVIYFGTTEKVYGTEGSRLLTSGNQNTKILVGSGTVDKQRYKNTHRAMPFSSFKPADLYNFMDSHMSCHVWRT